MKLNTVRSKNNAPQSAVGVRARACDVSRLKREIHYLRAFSFRIDADLRRGGQRQLKMAKKEQAE